MRQRDPARRNRNRDAFERRRNSMQIKKGGGA